MTDGVRGGDAFRLRGWRMRLQANLVQQRALTQSSAAANEAAWPGVVPGARMPQRRPTSLPCMFRLPMWRREVDDIAMPYAKASRSRSKRRKGQLALAGRRRPVEAAGRKQRGTIGIGVRLGALLTLHQLPDQRTNAGATFCVA